VPIDTDCAASARVAVTVWPPDAKAAPNRGRCRGNNASDSGPATVDNDGRPLTLGAVPPHTEFEAMTDARVASVIGITPLGEV